MEESAVVLGVLGRDLNMTSHQVKITVHIPATVESENLGTLSDNLTVLRPASLLLCLFIFLFSKAI